MRFLLLKFFFILKLTLAVDSVKKVYFDNNYVQADQDGSYGKPYHTLNSTIFENFIKENQNSSVTFYFTPSNQDYELYWNDLSVISDTEYDFSFKKAKSNSFEPYPDKKTSIIIKSFDQKGSKINMTFESLTLKLVSTKRLRSHLNIQSSEGFLKIKDCYITSTTQIKNQDFQDFSPLDQENNLGYFLNIESDLSNSLTIEDSIVDLTPETISNNFLRYKSSKGNFVIRNTTILVNLTSKAENRIFEILNQGQNEVSNIYTSINGSNQVLYSFQPQSALSMSNITVHESNCQNCLFLNYSGTNNLVSSSVEIKDFTFNNVKGFSIFSINSNMITNFEISGLNYLDSSIANGALMIFEYQISEIESLNYYNFKKWNFSGGEISSILSFSVKYMNSLAPQISSVINIQELLVTGCTITPLSDISAAFVISNAQLVLLNSLIEGIKLNGGFLFLSEDAANLIFSNVTFDDSIFTGSNIVYSNPVTTSKMAYSINPYTSMQIFSGCIFMNLKNIENGPENFFIYSNSIINILTNSAFYNISFESSNLINFANILETQNIANSPIPSQLFLNITSVQDMLQNISIEYPTICSGGCPYLYLSANIFNSLSMGENVAYLVSMNEGQNFLNIFENNTYLGITGAFSIYFLNQNAHNLIIQNENLYNCSLYYYIYFRMFPSANIFQNIIFATSNINVAFAIETILSSNLSIPNSIKFNNLIASYGRTHQFITLYVGNLTSMNLTYITITDYLFLDTTYEGLTVFNFETVTSQNASIVFSDINVTNIIIWNSLHFNNMYVPIMDNFLFYCIHFPGNGIYLVNSTLNRIQMTAKLTYLFNMLSGTIEIQNTTFNDITMTNTELNPLRLDAPNLVIKNVTFNNISISAYELFDIKSGFISNTFWSIYTLGYNSTIQLDSIVATNMAVEGFFMRIHSENISLTMKNSDIDYPSQFFSIDGAQVYFFLENLTFSLETCQFLSIAEESYRFLKIKIFNFFQKSNSYISDAAGPLFQIKYIEFYLDAENINLISCGFLITSHTESEINLNNLTFQGNATSEFIVITSQSNSLVSLSNINILESSFLSWFSVLYTGNLNMSLSNFILKDSLFTTVFFFECSENCSQSIIGISSLIIHNASGDNFLLNANGNENSLITYNNTISFYTNVSLYTSINANVILNNIIQAYMSDFQPIYDISTKSQTTKILNLINYNLISYESWVYFKSKQVSIKKSVIGFSSTNLYSIESALDIKDCIFQNNSNLTGSGGAIYMTRSDLNMSSTIANNNNALVGGFLYSNISFPNSINIQDTSYSNNIASIYGSDNATQPSNINFELIISNNTVSEYLEYGFSNVNNSLYSTNYSLTNVSSYLFENALANITIFDQYEQVIQFDNNHPLIITISYNSTNDRIQIIGDSFKQEQTISFPLSNIIIPPPNTSDQVTMSISFLENIYTVYLNISSRGCLSGEYFNQISQTCDLCPSGYYSININQSCQICPFGCNCSGGNLISILQNYWLDPISGNVFSCLNDEITRCEGGLFPSDICSPAYSGVMCQGCNITAGYFQTEKNVCSVCYEEAQVWFEIIVLVLSNLILQYCMIKVMFAAYKQRLILRDRKNQENPVIKQCAAIILANRLILFINFIQIVFIIFYYFQMIDFDIIDGLKVFNSVFVIASSQIQENYSMDCFMSYMGFQSMNITYVKITFAVFKPFIKMILFMAILLIRNLFKKLDHLKVRISIIFLVVFTNDVIGIIQYMTAFNYCEVGNVEGYSNADPNINCTSEQFINFKDTNLTYYFIFFGLIVFLLILLIYLNKTYLHNKFETMLDGIQCIYRTRAYFWTLAILLVKFVILFSFRLTANPIDGSVISMGILVLYSYMLGKIKPYLNTEVENSDHRICLGLIVCLVLINQAYGNQSDLTYLMKWIIYLIISVIFLELSFRLYQGYRNYKTFKAVSDLDIKFS